MLGLSLPVGPTSRPRPLNLGIQCFPAVTESGRPRDRVFQCENGTRRPGSETWRVEELRRNLPDLQLQTQWLQAAHWHWQRSVHVPDDLNCGQTPQGNVQEASAPPSPTAYKSSQCGPYLQPTTQLLIPSRLTSHPTHLTPHISIMKFSTLILAAVALTAMTVTSAPVPGSNEVAFLEKRAPVPALKKGKTAKGKAKKLAIGRVEVVVGLKKTAEALAAVTAANAGADAAVDAQVTAATAGVTEAQDGVNAIGADIKAGSAPQQADRDKVKEGIIAAKGAIDQLQNVTAADANADVTAAAADAEKGIDLAIKGGLLVAANDK
ncbi:hypothetical protein BDK51DRAFT_38822 [Blyttiomyces helicus]|uniref:Uncharacterized protein n=1 Tax=Blyttiomyces helicus TaxID=388810 RepID=A0A4V1IS17_9FUNG|nr:hypothetical protein BDK51DRAFT_38822 [Blyttiomyces helicus]|eukprot:RKO91997.1 hypothetical protein BDK51DRAFT_38822 [Blyttiomyces helicus]